MKNNENKKNQKEVEILIEHLKFEEVTVPVNGADNIIHLANRRKFSIVQLSILGAKALPHLHSALNKTIDKLNKIFFKNPDVTKLINENIGHYEEWKEKDKKTSNVLKTKVTILDRKDMFSKVKEDGFGDVFFEPNDISSDLQIISGIIEVLGMIRSNTSIPIIERTFPWQKKVILEQERPTNYWWDIDGVLVKDVALKAIAKIQKNPYQKKE